MKRLRCIAPRIGTTPARLATLATAGTGFARTDGLSPAERGYDADWRRVRKQVLEETPICPCGKPATDVDHIRPFRGLADPLRLARGNLRALCHPCHMGRTAHQAHGRGGINL
jgi:5-methylcytosine-specific restriction protein A